MVVERGRGDALSMRSAGTEVLTRQRLGQNERILGVQDHAYKGPVNAEQDILPYGLACPMERSAPT